MKNVLAIVLIMAISMIGRSQIIIDNNDMPHPGDSLRVSLTTIVPVDYTLTGMDTTWDFRSLEALTQRVDSFVNPNQTPQIYWLWFTPNITTNLASPLRSSLFPGVMVTDGFIYYKNDVEGYKDLGGAISYQGIPIPGKFDVPDKHYAFPLTAGSTWNSISFFSISLPGVAYLSSRRERNSEADGWGILQTPFGTFQTLRVKSTLIEHDSVYIDSLQTGTPFIRNTTEYKWLAKGTGIPVLQIIHELGLVTAIYRDSARSLLSIQPKEPAFPVQLYPNPAHEMVFVTLPDVYKSVKVTFFSTQGKTMLDKEYHPRGKTMNVDLSPLVSGTYVVEVKAGGKRFLGKIIKNQ